MSWALAVRARSFAVVVALVGAVLAGVAGCAGELNPSLFPGAGGSGGSVGQAGSGGGGGSATACDAPQMVFAVGCSLPGCHSANTAGGAGLESRIGGRGRSPPRPGAVDQHRCPSGLRERRQALPGRGLEPGDGPADGQDGRPQGDVRKHDVPARQPQFSAARLPVGLGDRGHDGSHHSMTTRSATMRAARAALLVPLLVAATSGSALGAGGKRAGVPKFDGAQEVVVRKQVMKALKAHGYALAKSREMDLGSREHRRAARVRRRFREGREGARAVGDRDGRDRQEAREDHRPRRQRRLGAGPGGVPGRESAENGGGGGAHVLEQARRGGRTRPRAVGGKEGAEGRGGGPGRRRKRARRG